jgi:hypothetical protein
MGTAYSRERRRGGHGVQRGRARTCEFRVGELVTLKNSGTGVYQIVEAEGNRVKLCNINDSALEAWFDHVRVETYTAAESPAGAIPPKRPLADSRPRGLGSKFN